MSFEIIQAGWTRETVATKPEDALQVQGPRKIRFKMGSADPTTMLSSCERYQHEVQWMHNNCTNCTNRTNRSTNRSTNRWENLYKPEIPYKKKKEFIPLISLSYSLYGLYSFSQRFVLRFVLRFVRLVQFVPQWQCVSNFMSCKLWQRRKRKQKN